MLRIRLFKETVRLMISPNVTNILMDVLSVLKSDFGYSSLKVFFIDLRSFKNKLIWFDTDKLTVGWISDNDS